MLRIQFPQINRRLTAGFWFLIFLILIGTNLLQDSIFRPTKEKKLRLEILQNPTISSLHEKLGQYYLITNEKAAENEYKIAQEYYHPEEVFRGTNVLGDQSTPWQTWKNSLTQKNNMLNELSYWEKIKNIYPDYIYSYLKLAVLHTQKGEIDKARVYLTTVLQTDPTNQIAFKLLQKLQ